MIDHLAAMYHTIIPVLSSSLVHRELVISISGSSCKEFEVDYGIK